MPPTDTENMLKELADINSFIRERVDPLTEESRVTKEETERLATAIAEIQDGERERKRAAVMRMGEHGTRLRSLGGHDLLDLKIQEGFARSATNEGFADEAWLERIRTQRQEILEAAKQPEVLHGWADTKERQLAEVLKGPEAQSSIRAVLAPVTRAAMDSTTAATGDELVATLQRAELWMDVNLRTLVAPLIPTFPMPSNPFDIPRQLGDINFYPGTENVTATSTAPATGRTTLSAYEIVGQVPWSFSLEEDSVIALNPEIRASVVRNVAEIMDDLILNADTTTTNNINADGATIAKTDAGKGHWLLGYDGLIHLPLIDNTSMAVDHNAAVSDDMFNEIRAKIGKYGVRPSELAWVMDVNTYIRSQSISNFRTMDKLGPNATLLNGMLGAVEGIPVIVSEQMLLTATDGKVTDGTAGTVGRLLLVNRTQWAQGFRRQLTVDVDRDTQKRQTVITVSFRHALVERSGTRSSATHTGLTYDITGV